MMAVLGSEVTGELVDQVVNHDDGTGGFPTVKAGVGNAGLISTCFTAEKLSQAMMMFLADFAKIRVGMFGENKGRVNRVNR